MNLTLWGNLMGRFSVDSKMLFRVGSHVQLKQEYQAIFSMRDKVGIVVAFDTCGISGSFVLVNYGGEKSFPFLHKELVNVSRDINGQYEFDFMTG